MDNKPELSNDELEQINGGAGGPPSPEDINFFMNLRMYLEQFMNDVSNLSDHLMGDPEKVLALANVCRSLARDMNLTAFRVYYSTLKEEYTKLYRFPADRNLYFMQIDALLASR